VTGVRLAFFGTPEFAVPSLTRLQTTAHDVVAVVTQPDRPRGRGHKVMPSPVGQHAAETGVLVLRPERLKDEEFLATFDALDVDLAVVAAYGKILPTSLLQRPRLGFINVHASLLPRWRGAAPIHRAVIAGDRETGITIMRVVPALDAGPMLATVTLAIGFDETTTELKPRLAEAGADLLVSVIDRLVEGPVIEEPQDDHLVTYASRIEKSEGRVNWHRPAADVHNHIRGLQPWPLVSAYLNRRRLMLTRSEIGPATSESEAPGTIVRVESNALVVATEPGTVRIVALQPEGRASMSVRDFLNGSRVSVGDRLEPMFGQ
jgi:methionyl-tRNA formyltransferase